MKINKRKLEAVLAVAAKVATNHKSLPILTGVQLQAVSGSLQVQATNLEVWSRGCVQVEADATATWVDPIVVDLGLLVRAVQRVAEDDVDLTTKDGKLLVFGIRATTTLAPLGAVEDWPVIPEAGDGMAQPATMASDAFLTLYRSIKHAIAKEYARPVLAGFLARYAGDTCTLVAADGFRLALDEAQGIAGTFTEQFDIPFPKAVLGPIEAALSNMGGNIVLAVPVPPDPEKKWQHGPYVFAHVGTGTHWTTLAFDAVDNTFPDYERIIPKDCQLAARVDTKPLLKALSESTKDKALVTRLDTTEHGIAVSYDIPDARSDVVLTVPATMEAPTAINISAAYLKDALNGTDHACLHIAPMELRVLASGLEPTLELTMKPMMITNDPPNGAVRVIMPMHKAR